jgi:hypothetical protein
VAACSQVKPTDVLLAKGRGLNGLELHPHPVGWLKECPMMPSKPKALEIPSTYGKSLLQRLYQQTIPVFAAS